MVIKLWNKVSPSKKAFSTHNPNKISWLFQNPMGEGAMSIHALQGSPEHSRGLSTNGSWHTSTDFFRITDVCKDYPLKKLSKP